MPSLAFLFWGPGVFQRLRLRLCRQYQYQECFGFRGLGMFRGFGVFWGSGFRGSGFLLLGLVSAFRLLEGFSWGV